MRRPYITQTKLFDTIEEYGNSGRLPTVLSRDICLIVGRGERKHTTPMYGAAVSHSFKNDAQTVDELPTEIVSSCCATAKSREMQTRAEMKWIVDLML